MTIYRIKSCFRTIQGEGAQAGRVAVFVRMSGCNLWDGTPDGRARAVCRFCDTDFVGQDGQGGGVFDSPEQLAQHADRIWSQDLCRDTNRFVVFTGGEPLLQLDTPLLECFHRHGFETAVETNGTIAAPAGIDWICVSPKAGAEPVQTSGHELKVVYPQIGVDKNYLDRLESLNFHEFSLLPQFPQNASNLNELLRNTRACFEYCITHPRWRLRVQTHKWINIP